MQRILYELTYCLTLEATFTVLSVQCLRERNLCLGLTMLEHQPLPLALFLSVPDTFMVLCSAFTVCTNLQYCYGTASEAL